MVGRLKRNDVPDMMVKERGRGKSLQQVLADGRSTGHFKLQGRCLQEARLGENVFFPRLQVFRADRRPMCKQARLQDDATGTSTYQAFFSDRCQKSGVKICQQGMAINGGTLWIQYHRPVHQSN